MTYERPRYVQVKNPRSGRWVKIDRKLGRIVTKQLDPYKPYEHIKIIEAQLM